MADPYLTPDAIRAVVGTTTLPVDRFPDEVLAGLVAEFEEVAEDYRGVAFTPREATWASPTVGCWSSQVMLPNPLVTAITDATVDGDAYDESTIEFDSSGLVLLPTSGDWVLTYTHGMEAPPAIVLRACREYVRSCALKDASGTSREVIAQQANGATFRYSTPDRAAGRPTGYIEVDRLLNSAPSYRVFVA